MAKSRPKRFTHAERARRRARIAQAVRGGASIAQVIKKFRVSANMARAARRDIGITPPGRQLAAKRANDRYERIAAAAARGGSTADLMRRFKVSAGIVYTACKRLGVKRIHGLAIPSPRTKGIMRALRAGRRSKSEIARRFGISQQRVSQIAARMAAEAAQPVAL